MAEAQLFGHWGVIVTLLKEGVSWEAIHKLADSEIKILLAMFAVFNEQQQEQETRSLARF